QVRLVRHDLVAKRRAWHFLRGATLADRRARACDGARGIISVEHQTGTAETLSDNSKNVEDVVNFQGPILRIFEVRTKCNSGDELLRKFATTSARVVTGEPGNYGFFFGREIEGDANSVIFVSVWTDLAAVKSKFGDDWQTSYMPAGYADLIEECSVRHVDLNGGWHVNGL
ncbi:MAG: antibiotic biosynthesis monooxygenase, partial [Hyphomicrobiaceae bacterium]